MTVTRREFVKAAALAGAAGLSCAAQEESPAPEKGKPKVGCTSWAFHSFGRGSDPEPAIDTLGEIGFDTVELILLAREDIKGFWTTERVDRIGEKLQKNGLEVSQFVIFQPVVKDLSSLDPKARAESLDYFGEGCRIGKALGAPAVNIVAPWSRKVGWPQGYLPRYYEIEKPKPDQKFTIPVAKDFDWRRTWDAWVETVKQCVGVAKRHGMKLSIEHHTHCLVPDASTFLLLWDAIRDPALGYNLDTGWTLLQREYPPVAIHKVGERLMNLHVRDIDGLMRKFPHIGEGVMDFRAVAEALKAVGFSGSLSLEQDKWPGDMKETAKRYLDVMRRHLGA